MPLPISPYRITLLVLFVLTFRFAATGADVARGSHGAVASVHPLASQAGLDALEKGGNAIDAAVAVALTLGVVDGHDSGIGGGCFMLIHLANGQFVGIDGREMAPAAATRDMFLRDGKADPALSQTGALASGIPGALAAYGLAVEKYGRKPLAELLRPAAEIAEKGFPIDTVYARKLKATAKELMGFEASHALLFKEGDKFLVEGDVLKQPDLAASYRSIAEKGTDWFYKGPYAAETGAWMKAHGGILTAEDFANYQVKLRDPVRGTYRGNDIISFPPPSSGGVHVIEIMNILENFDLKSLDVAVRVHVMAEAMKLAFADRAYWLGDPDFVKVPRGLLKKDYAKTLASRIKLDHVVDVPTHGEPPDSGTDVFGGKHTTHFSTADSEGNWVACTATINTAFGSKVIVPGTGIFLNDEMDDFSAAAGVPNHFGLVGSDANSVAAGKRPLSSMSPTVVVRDGKPVLSIGAAGGPTIITQTVINLVGILDLGLTPDQALAQKRFHHQWQPDELQIEESWPEDVKKKLEAFGHVLKPIHAIGASNAVGFDQGEFIGASEPRVPSEALAW